MRVGAVSRFKDAPPGEMPFIAYRHWSEIAGDREEASYMMARPLGSRAAPPPPLGAAAVDVRAVTAMVLSLAEQTVAMNASMAGGSCTFRELLEVGRRDERALARVARGAASRGSRAALGVRSK